MLQTIREHTQGWIAGIIISIIILTFALWGIHSYFVGGTQNMTVAEVNGVEITKDQLKNAYDRLQRQIHLQYGATNPNIIPSEAILKERALQGLVEIEVLKQAAIKQGFYVSPRQIDLYLQSLPDFQENGQFSVDKFQRILASAMMSPNDLFDLLHTSLLIDQPKLGIIYSSDALPNEINNTIALVNQDREIDFLKLPLQNYLSSSIAISNDAIKQYYDKHQSEFMTPETVSVNYITLSFNDIAKQMNPSEQELQTYYSENSNAFMTPTEWRLNAIEIPLAENASEDEVKKVTKQTEDIYTDLRKGTKKFSDYNNVYKTIYSGDKFVTIQQVPVELQQSVSGLKPGEFAKPIKTKQGYVIVKAEEVKSPQPQTFEAARDEVRKTYVRMRTEEKFAEAREQLADASYEHPDSLDYAAKKFNLAIQTSDVFSKDAEGKGIAQYKKIRDVAFSNDVLNSQNNSDVVQVAPDTAMVIHLKTHTPAAVKPLNEVSQAIVQKLQLKKAEALNERSAFEIKTKLFNGQNPQQIATDNKLSWTNIGFVGRYTDKVDSAILDIAFRMRKPRQAGKIVYDVARLSDGYAIIALKSVRNGALDEKQKAIFAEQIQNSDGLLEYELYKLSQRNNAKITIE